MKFVVSYVKNSSLTLETCSLSMLIWWDTMIMIDREKSHEEFDSRWWRWRNLLTSSVEYVSPRATYIPHLDTISAVVSLVVRGMAFHSFLCQELSDDDLTEMKFGGSFKEYERRKASTPFSVIIITCSWILLKDYTSIVCCSDDNCHGWNTWHWWLNTM
jgi:hypothetical protein